MDKEKPWKPSPDDAPDNLVKQEKENEIEQKQKYANDFLCIAKYWLGFVGVLIAPASLIGRGLFKSKE